MGIFAQRWQDFGGQEIAKIEALTGRKVNLYIQESSGIDLHIFKV